MKNLSIGKQLSIGFGFLVVGLIGAIIFSLYQQNLLASLTEAEFEHPFAVTNALARADGNLIRMSRAMNNVSTSENQTQAQQFISIVNELEPKVQADLAHGRERFLGDKTDFDALIGKFNEWKSIRNQVIALQSEGKTAEAIQATRTAGAPKLAEIEELLKKVYDWSWQKGADFQNNANEVRKSAELWTIGTGVLIALASIVIAVIITRTLTRPIDQAVHIAQTVATGDLSIQFQIEGNKEAVQLLTALKEMQSNLANIVANVRHDSENIATASSQIASGNLDLSSRTEAQASSLEETASSMEELTSTVKQNSDNARQANQLAQKASEVAAKGGSVVSEVVDTMGAINDSAKKIVDIISVIDGIAFQTNILALNAAVEAARAGEQGRGFAVVATEVRNLAQRSAAAAREIKGLIGDSVEKVEVGSKLVGEAGSTMTEVVNSIRQVTDIMAEIAAASREQTQGIEQVNQAVIDMDSATQQNASLVEEAAAAAKAMQDQAERLREIVSVFRLDATQTRDAITATSAAAARSLHPVAARIQNAKNTPTVQRDAAKRSLAPSALSVKMANVPHENADAWEEF